MSGEFHVDPTLSLRKVPEELYLISQIMFTVQKNSAQHEVGLQTLLNSPQEKYPPVCNLSVLVIYSVNDKQ
jgi:hypothetical protein